MGVTLYALLAGAAPHAEVKSVIALLHALVNEPAPPLALAAPWLPAGVVAVVERAMSRNREQRPRDAAELFAALRPLLPEGTELREEMLSGVGGRERASVVATGETAETGVSRVNGTAPAQEAIAAHAPVKAGASRRWIAVLVLIAAVAAAAAVSAGRW